jgi:hypothetical protein
VSRTKKLDHRAAGAALAALALFGATLQGVVARPTPALADTGQVDSAVMGWDGDRDAVIAHRDGSFDVRDHRDVTIHFGIYNNPPRVQWYNAGGYYPALVTQFERDNSTVVITSLGDKVTIGANAYVAVYSRVSVFNHDSVSHTLNPGPAALLLPLNSAANTVAPGQTVNDDYVIAVDRFGASYSWPREAF